MKKVTKSTKMARKLAASAPGLLLLLLLGAFITASNYRTSSSEQQELMEYVVSAAGTAAACDVAKGEWVPDPAAPYYTNATCPLIESWQDCTRYGKSVLGWRWQPHGCDLPRFDAAAFLRLVRGKSMAFVGDSVARNHLQSLICALAKVEYPTEVDPKKECVHCTRKYHYRDHDFTVCVFWTPFLVSYNMTPGAGGRQFMDPHNLYLDEPDPEWLRPVVDGAGYDYIILNGARWFTRPAVFYESGRIIGCANVDVKDGGDYGCQEGIVSPEYAVRASFRTALRALGAGFGGTVVVRTVAPAHYENGKVWEGGDCVRTTRPVRSNETSLPEDEAAFHDAQVDEFRRAASAKARKGRLVLMDVSEMMQMRGDGHPGQYGNWPGEKKVGMEADCIHWCLPGPVDAWNDLLLHHLLHSAVSS